MKRENYDSFFKEVIMGAINDIKKMEKQLMGDIKVLEVKNCKKKIFYFYQKNVIILEVII